jgi:hypothetical protein
MVVLDVDRRFVVGSPSNTTGEYLAALHRGALMTTAAIICFGRNNIIHC